MTLIHPLTIGSIDVQMTDGAGNMIHDWSRVFTTKVNFARAAICISC